MATVSRILRIALLAAVALAAGTASARPPRGEPLPGGGGVQPFSPDRPAGPMGGDAGQASPRERRLQWLNERGAVAPDAAPRMTREERRELRRDIHDAGREFYPRRPHR